jgi:cytochrome P450
VSSFVFLFSCSAYCLCNSGTKVFRVRRLLPTRTNRRMKQIASEIEALLKGIIAKRETALRAGEASSDDLLGLLLESNIEHCGGDGNSKAGITTDDVIGECKLFYFAGMETTSVLLTWTMILLSMHQEWQDRAREEVLHVFGERTPDYDGMSRLRIVSSSSGVRRLISSVGSFCNWGRWHCYVIAGDDGAV